MPEGAETDAGLTANNEAITRLGRLTRQQARFLPLICEGNLNTQIAYDLTIAETTFKAHIDTPVSRVRVWAAINTAQGEEQAMYGFDFVKPFSIA